MDKLLTKKRNEVIEMKRQLPKNVRQIGNVSDSSKIYVEDYVDTFFNQLCSKADQEMILAVTEPLVDPQAGGTGAAVNKNLGHARRSFT